MATQITFCQINFTFTEVQGRVLGLRRVILNTYCKFRNGTLSLCRNILFFFFYFIHRWITIQTTISETVATFVLLLSNYCILVFILQQMKSKKNYCFRRQHAIFKAPYNLSGFFHLFLCNSYNVAEIRTRSLSNTSMQLHHLVLLK